MEYFGILGINLWYWYWDPGDSWSTGAQNKDRVIIPHLLPSEQILHWQFCWAPVPGNNFGYSCFSLAAPVPQKVGNETQLHAG